MVIFCPVRLRREIVLQSLGKQSFFRPADRDFCAFP
jgi:hypothetical protein